MDILNEIPQKKFEKMDDLLAFISIYDDENRLEAYYKMLQESQDVIKGKVCCEAGCGFGLFAEYMAKLGAGKVYAVETNELLFEIAAERLKKYPQIEMVHADIRDFIPAEPVEVLVQELFGQLLYDEDIYSLDYLQFSPKFILPEKAVLMGGCIDSSFMVDDCVTPAVLKKLDGALVAGLFDEEDCPLSYPVIEWQYGKSNYEATCDITKQKGDVVYFGLQLFHNNKLISQAGECDNWSFVWTPRMGNRFKMKFSQAYRGMTVEFDWVD